MARIFTLHLLSTPRNAFKHSFEAVRGSGGLTESKLSDFVQEDVPQWPLKLRYPAARMDEGIYNPHKQMGKLQSQFRVETLYTF